MYAHVICVLPSPSGGGQAVSARASGDPPIPNPNPWARPFLKMLKKTRNFGPDQQVGGDPAT